MIKLGSIVKDRLTGIEGVVMVRAEYLTGCVHVGICQQKMTKEGKEPDWVWIDERRCKVLKAESGVMEKRTTIEIPILMGHRVGGPSPCGPKS